MAQDLLADIHSTPLDVLLSAISQPNNPDTAHYHIDESQLQAQAQALQDGYDHASVSDHARPSQPHAQIHDREPLDLDSFLSQPGDAPVDVAGALDDAHDAAGQDAAVAETIKQVLLTRNVAHALEAATTVSSVSLWHPVTGQKSYGKERRILNPPPTLFVSGPLADTLTYASVTTVIGYDKANGETSTVSSSTQAHSIPLAILEEEEDGMPPAKRAKIPAPERQKRERATAAKLGFGVSLSMRAFQTARHERDVLRDGLSFPTLTIPEAVGKEKEVALELVLGEPGVDPATVYDSRPRSDNAKAVEGDASTSAIDHAVLRDFFAQNGQIDQSREPADEGELPSSSTSTPAPWVTFRSAPLRVVSKPSQKTVKARSMLSCLSTNDTVSLFTRIHGQTVRTKYMKLETEPSARLSAKSGRWTPFRFEIIEPGAPLPKPARTRPSKDKILDEQYRDNVLTYGSIVRLEDVQSGYKSEPVKLVRVERNEAIVDGDIGQPVSELHRVGFVKVDDAIGGLARQYLSAPGARVGGAELELGESRGSRRRPRPKAAHASPAAAAEAKEEESAPHTSLAEAEQSATTSSSAAEPAPLGAESYPPGKRTSRRALARATIAEAEEGSTQAQLAWATANAETREVAIEEDGKTAKRMAQVEKVPDWMCWVITGVACSSFSFFPKTASEAVDPGLSAYQPPGRIPRMLEDPIVREGELGPGLEFALTCPNLFRGPQPSGQTYDFYLGPLGPLDVAFRRSASSAVVPPPRDEAPGTDPYDEDTVERYFLSRSAVHVSRSHIVISSGALPRYETIQDAIRETAPPVSAEAMQEDQAPQVDTQHSAASAAESWLGAAADITGQETLDSSAFELGDTLQSGENGKSTPPLSGLIDPSLGGPTADSVVVSAPGPVDHHIEQNSLPLLLVRRSDGLVLSLDKSWQWVDFSALENAGA